MRGFPSEGGVILRGTGLALLGVHRYLAAQYGKGRSD